MGRRLLGASMAAGLGLGAVLLGGCGGGNGLSLAEQACGHVHTSLALYEESLRDPANQAALQQRAATQLRVALPLAAAANSADGSWNPLMTDISEISGSRAVPGPRPQCAVAPRRTVGSGQPRRRCHQAHRRPRQGRRRRGSEGATPGCAQLGGPERAAPGRRVPLGNVVGANRRRGRPTPSGSV